MMWAMRLRSISSVGPRLRSALDGFLDFLGRRVGIGVVADDDIAARSAAHGELLHLEGQQPAVFTEFKHILGDFLGDTANHFLALQRDGNVPDRDQCLDLQGRKGAGDLVQPGAVPFQSCQGLVGAGQDFLGALQDVAQAVHVERDDLHGLANRNNGNAGLDGHTLCGAVPGT
jgi:hypothetical protein